jgi:uroporphyrinogen-III synthase
MATTVNAVDTLKAVKTILISQPKPERSPYFQLAEKFGIRIDWRPFIHVEPVSEKEFRKNRVRPDDFTSVILTSRNSIEHFFRMCEEMRVKISSDTKYFCSSEAVANYLQKFIVYRKRKVFVGKRRISDLEAYFDKHMENEKFILDLKDIFYDILVFFSPLGIKSLYDNFPDFNQNDTRIAVYGSQTSQAVVDQGLEINIKAPTIETPSMTMALEKYLKASNA